MAHRALITGPIIACCLESLFAAAGEATGSSGLCTVNIHKKYLILMIFLPQLGICNTSDTSNYVRNSMFDCSKPKNRVFEFYNVPVRCSKKNVRVCSMNNSVIP